MDSMLFLLFMSNIKISLIPYIVSYAIDRSCHFNKIAPVEKMHKNDESGFFRKP
jgi:hypothetical protein